MATGYPDFTRVTRPTRQITGPDQLRWYWSGYYDLAADTAVTITLATLESDERLFIPFAGCSRIGTVAAPSRFTLMDDSYLAGRVAFDRNAILNPGGDAPYDFAPEHVVKVQIINYDLATAFRYYYFLWGVLQYE